MFLECHSCGNFLLLPPDFTSLGRKSWKKIMTRSCKEAAVYIPSPGPPPPSSTTLNGLRPCLFLILQTRDILHPHPHQPEVSAHEKTTARIWAAFKAQIWAETGSTRAEWRSLVYLPPPAPDYWHLLPPRAFFSSCSDATPRVKDWIAAPSKWYILWAEIEIEAKTERLAEGVGGCVRE